MRNRSGCLALLIPLALVALLWIIPAWISRPTLSPATNKPTALDASLRVWPEAQSLPDDDLLIARPPRRTALTPLIWALEDGEVILRPFRPSGLPILLQDGCEIAEPDCRFGGGWASLGVDAPRWLGAEVWDARGRRGLVQHDETRGYFTILHSEVELSIDDGDGPVADARVKIDHPQLPRCAAQRQQG